MIVAAGSASATTKDPSFRLRTGAVASDVAVAADGVSLSLSGFTGRTAGQNGITRLRVYADRDEPTERQPLGVGVGAAMQLATRYATAGAVATIMVPQGVGKIDANDAWRAEQAGRPIPLIEIAVPAPPRGMSVEKAGELIWQRIGGFFDAAAEYWAERAGFGIEPED
jgi:hypothetical protein